MGQFSAELNYVRRLERYWEEVEERILNSEDWEKELERCLEDAMKEWGEEQGELGGEASGVNGEYGDSSLMMMTGDLSEEEKREIEKRVEKKHEVVTSDGLVLLQGPGEEEKEKEEEVTLPTLDLEIREIEALADGFPQTVEKLEELLSEEEKKQEELYREELFEATARKIEEEAESEGPLERLFKEAEEWAGVKEVGKQVEKPSEKLVEYEKPKETYYEELVEESDILEEEFEKLMEGEKSLKEIIEGFEEAVEEPEEGGELVEELVEEAAVEPVEELVEKVVEEEAEELVEEKAEGLAGEVEEIVEKGIEEAVEEVEEEVCEEVGREEEETEEKEELVKEDIEEQVELEGEVAEHEKLEEEIAKETLEETLSSEDEEIIVDRFERTISKSGHVERHGNFEKGLYLIRTVRRKDEKTFTWSTRKDEKGDALNTWVPKRFLKELVGKDAVVTIIKYDYLLHFRCIGSNFRFSPREGLIVDGKKIGLEKVKPLSWSERHGASMMVKLAKKSMQGAEVYLVFYEDGEVSVTFSEDITTHTRRATLAVEGGFLVIKYEDQEAMVPIVKLWRGTWKLSDEEIKRIRDVMNDESKLGAAGRDKVEAVIRAGEIPEIKDVKEVYKEIYIAGTKKHVDLVIETWDGHLIVVEVKATMNPKYLDDRLEEGIEDLEKKYKVLINRYGLDLEKAGLGMKRGEDIETYVSVSVYFNLKNKKADAMCSILSPIKLDKD
ncbi:MAG: hypothetical protein FGF51_07130 [Candidatus Brockarchaeota archaeon]|nr:hypothetical protein [Candidatus Brockarchaeota archaeon]